MVVVAAIVVVVLFLCFSWYVANSEVMDAMQAERVKLDEFLTFVDSQVQNCVVVCHCCLLLLCLIC